jgi:pimeloyl-ACP methyl ester carboxylesterase
VLLIHAGICDSGMWDPQWESFPQRHRTVRADLRGFGRTPISAENFSNAADVVELLEGLELGPVSLVGVSLGGRVALEIAAARPDLVDRLIVSGAPLPGYEWSEEVSGFGAAEDAALDRGDLDAAVEANLRMWVDGPRRGADEVDPGLRRRVGGMQRRAFELQLPVIETADEKALVEDLTGALSEIRAPTLTLVGELDAADMRDIAALLADRIPGARGEVIGGTAHVPSLERPDEFDRLVLGFLA